MGHTGWGALATDGFILNCHRWGTDTFTMEFETDDSFFVMVGPEEVCEKNVDANGRVYLGEEYIGKRIRFGYEIVEE